MLGFLYVELGDRDISNETLRFDSAVFALASKSEDAQGDPN